MKRKAYDGVYNRYIKRGIDFCLALIGLVIAAIPMAIVAIAIKAESKGPVIFKQDRIGYKGKVYKMYKYVINRKNITNLNKIIIFGED